MKTSALILMATLCCLTACNKSSAPASSGAQSSTQKPPDAVQQKLVEYSSAGATDCGRLDVHAVEAQFKAASGCAMQAAQNKHPFYVAYDMPGMIVGVAGNSDGKLFTAQAQGPGSPGVTTGACPSALRVASSGRVSCFAPGDLTSMSGSHAAGTMPAGTANPHAAGTSNPHAAGPKSK